jgi:Ca2+-binding EF-hand superfamily protein
MLMKSLTMAVVMGVGCTLFVAPSFADEQKSTTQSADAQHDSNARSKSGKSKERHKMMKDRMAKKFAKADADRDGKVSLDEAKANAPKMAEHFSEIDKNGDGFITKDEMKAAHKGKKKDCDEYSHGDDEKG